jgi:hypothetical protein
VAIYWSGYVGLTYLLEATLFRENPQALRQDILRNSCALVMGLLTILLMKTRVHDIVKAILLLSGLTVFLMALVLHFYRMMWLAVILVALVSGIIIGIIIKSRKPWFYHFAIGMAIVVALLYAWPR